MSQEVRPTSAYMRTIGVPLTNCPRPQGDACQPEGRRGASVYPPLHPISRLTERAAEQEAKAHSKEVLDDMDESGDLGQSRENEDKGKNKGNVIGGHKATLKNPNVGEEAKEHSRQVLEENGADY